MRFRWGVALLGALAFGCDDQQARLLHEDYSRAITADEHCQVATRIADHHLKEANDEEYRKWSLTRDIDCDLADARRQTNLR